MGQPWEASIPAELVADCKEITTAAENWGEEIFNYFDHPHTSAYAEQANRWIKKLQLNGNGYKFETLRARVISYRLKRAKLEALMSTQVS